MKYCPECSSENIDESKFCVYCGKSFEDTTDDSPVSTTPSYAINSPVVTDSYPPPQYARRIKLQPAYTPTEELIAVQNSSGLKTFMQASLLYTMIPLVLILINLFFESPTLELLFTIIALTPLPIFTYGFYKLVNDTPPSFKTEGSQIINLLVIYCVLGSLYSLVSVAFIPTIPADASLRDMQGIAFTTFVITLIGLIPEVIFLLGALKFTDWFNELIRRIGLYGSTERFRWYGILKVVSNISVVLSLLLLMTLTISSGAEVMLLLASLLILFGAIAVLAASIMQILAGYKIYKILKQTEQVNYISG